MTKLKLGEKAYIGGGLMSSSVLEYALEQENKWQLKLVKNRLKSIDKRHKKV